MHKSMLGGLIIDCKTGDLEGASQFWSAALGMKTRALPGEEGKKYVALVDPDGRLDIEVQTVDHESRVHLDIESDDIEAEARRLEKLGARRLERIKGWVVMEAPTGQKFCIVKPRYREFEKKANRWE